MECSVSDLDGCLERGDFCRNAWLDHNHTVQEVRADTEEMLVPYAEMLGIAPCLEECAGTLHPVLAFARMCIRIFAEAAYSAFMQSLTVHVLEELPCLLYLSVFDHALHRHAVVP